MASSYELRVCVVEIDEQGSETCVASHVCSCPNIGELCQAAYEGYEFAFCKWAGFADAEILDWIAKKRQSSEG